MPNVRPMPATSSRIASAFQPTSGLWTTADNAATVPITPSPSVMITSSP